MIQLFVDYFKKREAQQLEPQERSERQYAVLDTVAVLQKRCAALFLVVGLFAGFTSLVVSPHNWAVGFAFVGASILQFLVLSAFAELIYVFLDIERNTRSILQIEQNTRSIARKGLAEFLLG